MADSEISRTLPSIRYRNILLTAERLLSELAMKECGSSGGDANEVLKIWAAWSLAHSEYSRLCNVQQRIESELFGTAARQAVEPRASYSPRAAQTATLAEVDAARKREASGETPLSTDADLVTCGLQGKSVDYIRAKAAEDAASAREHSFAKQLWSVSGGSAVSALAKLHCILEQGEPAADSAEFPWPQIRSALADLLTANRPGPTTHPDQGRNVAAPLPKYQDRDIGDGDAAIICLPRATLHIVIMSLASAFERADKSVP